MRDLTALRKFYAPEFVFGRGARALAGRHAANLGARRVLVVTDPGVAAAGWTGEVLAALTAEGLVPVVYDGVTPNPRVHEVLAGAEVYRDEGCNAIVAVGGGSPIDCAKGIGVVSANGTDLTAYEGVDEIPLPGPPLICVPTTAGSAADVSQFAIFADPRRRLKFAVVSKKVVPDVSLVDPETTGTVAPFLAACTGMDALTHALEATVSNASSPLTDLHALAATRLAREALPRIGGGSPDAAALDAMALATLESGLAFSNASLGAIHAMAHALGGRFDAPHGFCDALLMPLVVEFNYPAAPAAHDRFAEALGLDLVGMTAPERCATLVEALRLLLRSLGIDGSLRELGATRADVRELAEHAMGDVCMVTNPRRPTRGEVEALYEQAL